MITRFFKTSKPIHFVIMAAFTFVIYMLSRVNNLEGEFKIATALRELGVFSVVLISVFVFDFLVSKNNLTQKNGYDLLLFSLLFAMLPITMHDSSMVFSNLFVLLALRRILSLKSNLSVKKKLFDAAFWITIASLFYFWSILFFLLIIAAMFFFAIGNFKNWIIPFIGVIVVVLITISFSIITNNTHDQPLEYLDIIGFDFTTYKSQNLLIPIVVIIAVSAWTLVFYFISINKKQKANRPSHLLTLLAFIIGVTIICIAPIKNGDEFLFVFPPLAIIMSNYLESVKKQWLAELFVWLLILTSASLLML